MGKGTQYKAIEDLDVFQMFEEVSDEIWTLASKFDDLARATLGRQMVRAADSVGANLVEGDGRFSEREAIHFFYIARGSARELRYWIKRCQKRNLLNEQTAGALQEKIRTGAVLLNHLIKFRKESLTSDRVRENSAPYGKGDPLTEALN